MVKRVAAGREVRFFKKLTKRTDEKDDEEDDEILLIRGNVLEEEA